MDASVGIDIGTTNSYVAVNDGDHPSVIPTRQGLPALPAVVAVASNGRRLVGSDASSVAVSNAENTVYGVTRLLGLPASSPVVRGIAGRVPYRMARGPQDELFICLPGWNATPLDICSLILQVQREQAERYLEAQVQEAVLTVPNYYEAAQQEALVQAGRKAGFSQVSTIPQTVAAAHAHGYMERPGATVVVYHMGGGTFEVAVLGIGAVATEVLASGGEAFLGGDDIDDRIVDWFIDCTLQDQGFDIGGSALVLQGLRPQVRAAKSQLTDGEVAEIVLPYVLEGETIELRYTLTRAELERMAAPLLERTAGIATRVLQQAGVGLHQVDDLLLVGGQSRMPLVQRMAAEVFRRRPTLSAAPEETIAVGACIGSRSGGGEDEPLELAY